MLCYLVDMAMGYDRGKSGEISQSELFSDRQFSSLAAAAHDLKSPLGTIHYLASTLRDKELDLSDSETEELLWRMQLSAQRGLQLVEGFVYAFNASQLKLELEPVNVTHVCEDILNELKPLTSRLDQKVEIHSSRNQTPLALAHHTALKSVITNLCDNALKHSPKRSRINIRIGQHDDKVSVAIRDNGPVMRLGDYRQLKNRLGTHVHPLGTRSGSSGLGLYIASQLSDAMEGELGVVRHQQGGVTFAVRLQPSYQLSLI